MKPLWRPRISWLALLACLVLGLAGAAAPHQTGQAQIDDWSAVYRPALLPEFTADMAAHADAPRYSIALTLKTTPDRATVTGSQRVTYTNRTAHPLPDIVFRLYPNLDSYGADMRVEAVQVDGADARPTLDPTRSILTVPLPSPLPPTAQVVIDLDFHITLEAGPAPLYAQFGYQDGVLSLPNAYPVLSIYEAGRGWWQVTDHPQGDVVFSETAFYTVSVTAPPSLVIAASGTAIDLRANPDGTLVHRYVAPLMRDFALFASPQYVAVQGEQDGVTITLFYDHDHPHGADAARAGLALARDAVRIFNRSFGRYPFSELDIVQTPTTAGGIEYPGLFVVSDDQWDAENEFFSFVIAHETAHQWWYSLVGNDQTQHPWLDEALAQYAVALFIRDREGEAAYRAALDSFQAQVEAFTQDHPDDVIGLPVTDYPGPAYFYVVYQKGPLLFAALEDVYGFDMVGAMLRDYFAAYRYGIATPEDLKASFEATAGTDLGQFFSAWVGTIAVG